MWVYAYDSIRKKTSEIQLNVSQQDEMRWDEMRRKTWCKRIQYIKVQIVVYCVLFMSVNWKERKKRHVSRKRRQLNWLHFCGNAILLLDCYYSVLGPHDIFFFFLASKYWSTLSSLGIELCVGYWAIEDIQNRLKIENWTNGTNLRCL